MMRAFRRRTSSVQAAPSAGLAGQRARGKAPLPRSGRTLGERLALRVPDGSAGPAEDDRVREDLAVRLDASRGRGSPLPGEVRSFMEPRFGADFGDVRVHTGGYSAQLSRALGARAFTAGSDVYLGEGRSPRNDPLMAHELTHVVQQAGAAQPAVVQRAPEDAPPPPVSAEDRRKKMIDEAAAVIDEEKGSLPFHYVHAELEGELVFVLFDDVHVHRLFRYLLKEWLGPVGPTETLENAVLPEAPRWVGEFRARALNLRARKPTDPDYDAYLEQKRLADLALRLADSVAAETPAQKLRKQFVAETDKRIGTTVMTQAEIDAERSKAATGGLTPQNFTTCIEFFSQVTRAVTKQSGIKSPLLLGPNAYKEINPQATQSLPPGAWHPCTPDTRPKPGDLLIFTFAQNEKNAEGKVKYYKGWFAHISIVRSIEALKDKPTTGVNAGASEKWISVDGGGTTAAEVVRWFYPETCLIKGPGTTLRTLHGWIDIEAAAQAHLVKLPGGGATP